ncbi:MAG TPA: DUF6438 domain-containing protein [Flavobacteriales bacterium]|nr:DUF6438 domain-containing protein [Flavobacteriales bacterium]HRO39493.1 DUF6438 domain-containing protein [Flavobacteriales bacterium]HRP81289.1 DUF6438 domain-containing protein [Flavobacteriales bacterium]HRQ84702.1 DUF6438 domain-containing protein [Flavobacteriales bacterium]
MHITNLFIAAAVLAFATGCKSKQEAAAATTAASTAQPAAETVPQEAGEPEQDLPKVRKLGDGNTWFAIQRTPCFGTCPVYKLIINSDGSAIYEGGRFAPREGMYTGHVEAATVQALVKEAEAAGFFGLKEVYDAPVTDLPSLIIRVNDGGRDKQVKGRVGAPQSFKDLAQHAEEMLAGVEWTKVEEEH